MAYIEASLGLLLLLGGGDALVRGSVALAKRAGLSALFIGLTVVACGTSAPELMTSVQAVLSDLPSMAIGNVVGSNIANVLLVMGLPALFTPIACGGRGVLRNTLIMIAATLAFIVAADTGVIGFGSGAVLFALLVTYLTVSARRAIKGRQPLDEVLVEMDALEIKPPSTPIAALMTVGGIAGLVFGSNLLVEGGAVIAALWGVPEAVIALSLVAIGTSLPELATCLAAALRNHAEVAIGNVVGSNLFNLLGIVGVTAMVRPIAVAPQFLAFDIWVMLGTSLLLVPLAWRNAYVGRILGLAFVLGYVAYIATLGQSWSSPAALP